MQVDTIPFLLFLVLSLAGFYLIPARFKLSFLFLASIFFTGFEHWWFSACLIGSTLTGFFFGNWLNRFSNKRILYFTALILSIGQLTFFKYKTIQLWLIPWDSLNLGSEVLLPLGISYYTFQQIGYLTEIYWGREKPEPSFVHFAAYLTFFPKLVAGPIERAHPFLQQLKNWRPPNRNMINGGLQQMLWGIFKKMVIADRLNVLVLPVLENPQNYSGITLGLSATLFAIQLYADFSGYTDIALGTAKLFGLKLSPNFDRPFFARSVSAFWRKWHISLSSWIADYIYQPLSSQLQSLIHPKMSTAMSLLVAFAIFGVWHGSTSTFLFFGLLHSVALILQMLTRNVRKKLSGQFRAFSLLGNVFTILFFIATLSLFYASSISEAIYILAHTFDNFELNYMGTITDRNITFVFAALFIPIDHLAFKHGFHTWCSQQNKGLVGSIVILLLLMIALFSGVENIPFIYERF